MKKFLIYALVAVITFIAIVIAFAPAALLWRQVDNEALSRVPELAVAGVRGTLWQGRADLFYRQFPGSALNWTVAPMPALTRQQADSLLTLSGEGHDLRATLSATARGVEVHSATGFVEALYINRVSQPQGLTFDGRVDIRRLSLKSDFRWIETAEGEIYWPGGKIVSRTLAAGTRVFDLPPLLGEIRMRGADINLILHPENPNQVLVDILVKPNGWVVVAVKARLFDLAGLPWPAGSSLNDTVLQFEEQLLQGAR